MVDNPNKDFLSMGDEDFLQISPSTIDNDKTDDVDNKDIPNENLEDTTIVDDTTKNNSEELTNKEEDKSSENKAEENKSEWKEYENNSNKSDEENTTAKLEHDKTKPLENNQENIEDPVKKAELEAEKELNKTADESNKDNKKEVPNYENFFKQVMMPFKANGKEITVNSAEEVIRLMQMGAGYGRKLNELQPHLKIIRMLEKNSITEEDQLSFLIDLNQKKPDAIRKLIKDSGIDPLDLNTDDTTTYTPTNHSVSDSEINFQTALKDVMSSPNGSETIKEINTNWDQRSKEVLWESPEILEVIQSQRENGLYDQISAEIDRQKLLGHIPQNKPFIEAYKIAGDYLVQHNLMKLPKAEIAQPNTSEVVKDPVVLATRVAPVKTDINGEKAKAAAATKASANTVSIVKNPLEMSDEDFKKQFNGRL